MKTRIVASIFTLVSLLAPAVVAGQAVKGWVVPRTPDGHPDLQGTWNTSTLTALERPAEFAGKPVLTPQEAKDYEARFLRENNRDRRDGTAEADVGRAYNEFWYDRGSHIVESRHTSLIIDPPDGKIPALTPEAQKRQAALAEYRRQHPGDGPEDFSLANRCILWATAGPPMLPGAYNNNYRIVQSPGNVTILVEMIHDARIIPTDGRLHLPSTSDSGSAIRVGIGRVIRWSWKPRISPTRPISGAPTKTCVSSSASRASTQTRSSTNLPFMTCPVLQSRGRLKSR